jgi:phospholipase/carboxylesterase
MRERQARLAGLDTWLIGADRPKLRIVFLHGYDMSAANLTPFAHSLSIPGVAYAFPQAPDQVSATGRAWWARIGAIHGVAPDIPRDLWRENPVGRDRARLMIGDFVTNLRKRCGAPILLAGFSQGGMLGCDATLMQEIEVAGLALMSASCIAFSEWHQRRQRLAQMPAFISHGRSDLDLSFGAGQRLCAFFRDAGALLTWVPFDGGHSIPFPVWRQFKQFVNAMLSAAKEDSLAHSN